MKLQCVVTSYKRPKYLKPCLESMLQDDIELYVVDGGSDEETKEYIKKTAHGFIFLEDNPGADVLKTEGIKNFVTQPEFVISSDDYIYPKGWSDLLFKQYHKLNAQGMRFPMMASPTELVIARHTQDEGVQSEKGVGVGKHYHFDSKSGLEIMPTSIAMVAGTIMDTELTKKVEYFPVYGKTGQGDIAISLRFHTLGFQVGYFRNPVLQHVGQAKRFDYPEYTEDFAADDAVWYARAKQDVWTPKI